jgi:RimJ/RimL family protein N-acetyltransferase
MDQTVSLRPIEDSDLDAVFEQMRDPESVRMAAFTPADPDDRSAFDARMERLRSSAEVVLRVIEVGRYAVGTIAAFGVGGETELTYWVDRRWWGKGVASAALSAFLGELPIRPLHARAASDNIRSIRVLEKHGFRPIGTDRGFAPGRDEGVDETIFVLE